MHPSSRSAVAHSSRFSPAVTVNHHLSSPVVTHENPNIDVESGGRCRRRSSTAGSSEGNTTGSRCFSDSDDQSWHSPLDSIAGGSLDECRFLEIVGISVPRSHKEASMSDRLSYNVELEIGDLELKVHSAKTREIVEFVI
ncbi:hypothetical protein F0562_016018 [Nyssa sinensis]|uniref:Uncharacterized protein n=1 Tax=Nyssa sinensis TaxID=561372 RepID=A0A5J4ZLB0_9ASTE|nr:hypothetical protein F0562_016018 [Nyssa sinensis]